MVLGFFIIKKLFQTNIINFDKYEFEIDIEKNQGIRFKQVEERSLKELFSQNQTTKKKISKSF